MKTDAVVLGAELDALVAALRLRELGHSVRVLNAGAGSLHYAPGGIHVLGYTSDAEPVRSPLERIEDLDERHPYRLVGAQVTSRALDWFFETTAAMGLDFRCNGSNITAIAPSGCSMPVYGPNDHQATRDTTDTKNVAVVRFRGHRDFPAGLAVSALTERGCVATLIEVDGPLRKTDTVTLAKAFDVMTESESYFADLKSRLPKEAEIVIFPAVLGLHRHRSVIEAAEHCLSLRCLELPTLPPSVPGMRLHRAFEARLQQDHVPIHTGARFNGAYTGNGRCDAVEDSMGRAHEGSVFLVATGGVLMGGLQVESSGQVHETNIGLEVFQTRPLERETVDQSLDALHRAGVETDSQLRARGNGSASLGNVFVTGRTLAHWNPASEISAEGVSIVTGWLAAQSAHDYLRG